MHVKKRQGDTNKLIESNFTISEKLLSNLKYLEYLESILAGIKRTSVSIRML